VQGLSSYDDETLKIRTLESILKEF